MKVNECFYSFQGEGLLTGVPSYFIRLAGCPLRCSWCDTKYAWDYDSGDEASIPKVIDKLSRYSCDHVVVTGGEPMVLEDFSPNLDLRDLSYALKEQNKHVTIETSGVTYIDDLDCDLMSISPKFDNPQSDGYLNIDVVDQLIQHYNYQLKCVIDKESDMDNVNNLLSHLKTVDRSKVFLMPQASSRDQLLNKLRLVEKLSAQTGFSLTHRLHLLFGGK